MKDLEPFNMSPSLEVFDEIHSSNCGFPQWAHITPSSPPADANPQHTSCASVSNAFHDYFPLGGGGSHLGSSRRAISGVHSSRYLPTFHHPPISETFSQCSLPGQSCVDRVEFFAELSLCEYDSVCLSLNSSGN